MSDQGTPAFKTVNDLVSTRGEEKGEETLMHFEGEEYSYRTVNRQANAIANVLRGHGITPGRKVSTLMRNRPEHLLAQFGVMKAGGVVVPLNADLEDAELEYAIENCDTQTIILEEATRDNYEAVRDGLTAIEREYLCDGYSRPGYVPFAKLLDGGETPPSDVSVSASDPLSIIYTSGTTGQPKGVMLPHYSYISTGTEYANRVFDLDQTDRPLTTLPLWHCNVQQTTVMGSMLAGTDFVLGRDFDPETFWDLIRETDATIFHYLGTMISHLYQQDEAPGDAENPVAYGIGANAPDGIIEPFEERFDVQIVEGYGLTETSTVATVNPVDDRKIGSIGTEVSYVDIQIVDEEDRPLPAGEEGEIVVRPTEPNTLMLGYYNKYPETVDSWRNLWLHTGDIGYKDEDGYLYFVDRKAYAIQQQGNNISSFEVENVLSDHPDIREVAVIGVQNAVGNEEVKAVVVPEPRTNMTEVEIAEYCDDNLRYFEVPRFIEIRHEVPKTATERIRKYELMKEGVGDAWDRESGYELKR